MNNMIIFKIYSFYFPSTLEPFLIYSIYILLVLIENEIGGVVRLCNIEDHKDPSHINFSYVACCKLLYICFYFWKAESNIVGCLYRR